MELLIPILNWMLPWIWIISVALFNVVRLVWLPSLTVLNRINWGRRAMRQSETPAEWLAVSVSALPMWRYRAVLLRSRLRMGEQPRLFSLGERLALEREFGTYGVGALPEVRTQITLREG